MNSRFPRLRSVSGVTLPEMLLGAAVASILLGGLMVGTIALSRAFAASERLARSQADMLRVSDYLARDIRNATGVNTTANAPVILTLTAPDYYDQHGTPGNPADDVANSPVLTRTGVSYGAGPVTIRYVRAGNRIRREVTRGGTTTAKWIADDITGLAVTIGPDGMATITSSAESPYCVPQSGKPQRHLSFVMSAQSHNANP